MRKLLLLLSFPVVIIAAIAQEEMPRVNQKPFHFKQSQPRTLEIEYLLFLPESYDAGKKKLWPLMLFLHGAGERGTNINRVTVHGPPKIVKQRPDFPFIVVSPQCPSGQRWQSGVLLSLLDEICEKHRVDTNRVYLTGLSMGGYGTWNLGLSHPERFAAIVPICGGGSVLDILLPSSTKQKALKTLPVWAFHGAKDTSVKLIESERMVEELKRFGNQAQLTVYPEAGHDSWTETYNNPRLYDWLLEQSLEKRKISSGK